MRLRILFLIDHLVDDGGAERFALGLATHLPPERFERWMCSTRSFEPAAVKILNQAGVRHVHVGRSGKLDPRRLIGLVKLLRRERFDVVHAHMFGSNLWGSVIGRACGVPTIIAHEHTWSYDGEPLRRWLDGRVIGRLASRFIAVSSNDAERMVSIEHVPADKVVMIPTAYVPRARTAPSDTDLRTELSLSPAAPVVAAIAALRPQKALSVLLDAYRSVLAAIPTAHLVVAGEGECRDALERQAIALGIGEHVHFLGRRSDIDGILQCADLAALSSDYEGTPLVAYECFAQHTALVATAVGGLPDIIEDGRTGRLVPPRDPLGLAAVIIELLNDPEQRDRIARAAADSSRGFTMAALAPRFAALYETLTAGAPATRRGRRPACA